MMGEGEGAGRIWALLLCYDGTFFRGFARQPGQRTVQGVLEAALSSIFGEDVRVAVAGRTDAGVHALGQVVSFLPPRPRPALGETVRALRSVLPQDLSVLAGAEAPPGFHARRSALSRTYVYQVLLGGGGALRPFLSRYAWVREGRVDLEAIYQVGSRLVGKGRWDALARRTSESRERTIFSVRVRARPPLLWLEVQGDSFARGMVRRMAGALVAVGEGRARPGEVLQALERGERGALPPTAPPQGLFLARVFYGDLDPFRGLTGARVLPFGFPLVLGGDLAGW